MRILLVHNRYRQPGGEDAAFEAEAGMLRRAGHAVRTFAVETRAPTPIEAPAFAARALWSLHARRALRPALASFQPEIVHFHNTFPLLSPAVYYECRKAGVPVVQTLHNYRLLCAAGTLFRAGAVCEECPRARSLRPALLHGCYRGSRAQTAVVAAMLGLHRTLGTWDREVGAYIALTEFARRKLVEGGLPEAKVFVKPNFVAPAAAVPPSAAAPSAGAGSYALFVGRLSPEKGIRTLLEAWRLVAGIPLLVAGDGPLRGEADAAASRLGGGRLRILGWQDRGRVGELMRGARFLVFPSLWYESFPLVLAESFGCGLPVVAAGLGAAAEIVRDGRSGLHFRPGDAADLAARAAWLWSRPGECRRMGVEGRAQFEAEYGEPRNCRTLMGIYERLLAGGGRNAPREGSRAS